MSDDIRVRIGNRIRELRNTSGYSQEVLAQHSSLDRTYINSVENGRRNISIVNLEKIALALNITLSNFFQTTEFNNE